MQPKHLSISQSGLCLKTFLNGVKNLITGDDNLLMWYTIVWKASHQSLKGSWAWARRVKPNSTICLCFFWTNPFWWCVYRQECLNMMPEWFKNSMKCLYSAPSKIATS